MGHTQIRKKSQSVGEGLVNDPWEVDPGKISANGGKGARLQKGNTKFRRREYHLTRTGSLQRNDQRKPLKKTEAEERKFWPKKGGTRTRIFFLNRYRFRCGNHQISKGGSATKDERDIGPLEGQLAKRRYFLLSSIGFSAESRERLEGVKRSNALRR